MKQGRPALFRGRHFEHVIIVLCVRWYLRYSLSYRDLQEMMGERGLSVNHVTIWRWVQRYALILDQRLNRERRRHNRSWRVDETYVRIAGNWVYLYRAVDSAGDTIDFMLSPNRDLVAAKQFLQLALHPSGRRPRVVNVDGHPAYASAIADEGAGMTSPTPQQPFQPPSPGCTPGASFSADFGASSSDLEDSSFVYVHGGPEARREGYAFCPRRPAPRSGLASISCAGRMCFVGHEPGKRVLQP